jgi:hypothetical protein
MNLIIEPDNVPVVLTGIGVSGNLTGMAKGETRKLSITSLLPENATEKSLLIYVSSGTEKVTVDLNGNVTINNNATAGSFSVIVASEQSPSVKTIINGTII